MSGWMQAFATEALEAGLRAARNANGALAALSPGKAVVAVTAQHTVRTHVWDASPAAIRYPSIVDVGPQSC